MCVVNLESVNKLDLTWKQSFLIGSSSEALFADIHLIGVSKGQAHLHVVGELPQSLNRHSFCASKV